MKRFLNPAPGVWPEFLQRTADTVSLDSVRPIVDAVRSGGDKALFELTSRLDRVTLETLWVSPETGQDSRNLLSETLVSAIEMAESNIRAFHKKQAESDVQVAPVPGVFCWRKSVPINHVGLYVPGGRAPLFSTLLMLGIPARLAGCPGITVCTPPRSDGSVDPAILFVARRLGIDRIFTVGGAQAIAAMAFGTETIPAVDKIFGPGNQWVTLAKQLVEREGVAIDMPAGPTELAAIVDDSCHPAFIAADLLAQAEHGPDSYLLLIATDTETLDRIDREVRRQLPELPRRETIQTVLDNSVSVVLDDVQQGLALSNLFAPEHLLIATRNAHLLAEKVQNAGSVFVGDYAAPAAGDYITGTNHTLPTSGFARATSGVSLDSFVKKITFQSVSRAGFETIGSSLKAMAIAEDLTAHAASATVRLDEPQTETS